MNMKPAFDRRVTAVRADLAAEQWRGVHAAPRYAAGIAMRVADASVPLRREPRQDAPLDTELLHGEVVLVYARDEGWAWLQAASDGYVGYVPEVALMPQTAVVPTHRVNVLRTFVYHGASMKLPPAMTLTTNAAVAVTGTEGAFAHIPEGFVWARHLSPLHEPSADWVAVAEAFVGVPYLWGGKTSLGLDCSALAQQSLATVGIAVPRDSDMQEAAQGAGGGETLAADTPLRRGDLIFWNGHVGIMTDAQTLLHANGHHMLVVKEPLEEARARILSAGAGPVTRMRRLNQ